MAVVASTHNSTRNRLLAALSREDFGRLQPHLRPTELPLKTDMELPHERIDFVYFMEAGIASVVATLADSTAAEVGLIGCEGMSGTAVVLGGDRSPHSTYIQVTGEAQRLPVNELRRAMDASGSVRTLLLKYVQVFMVQTAHTAIANARAHIDQRLSRWILMAHDRTRDNTLPLTHEFLALMLAVRRPGVTEALQSLRRQKLIDSRRNQIVVLDRKGIEQAAGDSYGMPEMEYRRLIG
jgi:CRP-like cAMP-binding protein